MEKILHYKQCGRDQHGDLQPREILKGGVQAFDESYIVYALIGGADRNHEPLAWPVLY